jgi:opacity protein-like surface antigen
MIRQMTRVPLRRLFLLGAATALAAVGAASAARAADPCALVTAAEVSAAIGGPLSDFKIPVGPEKNGG